MRLNQIYVRHYGPVQKDLELDGDINVIRGPNESGKSLLVEALLKRLADGSVTNPVISESPEGFVEITDGSNKETLQDGDSLTEFCEENYNQAVRAEELRNIFVIRRGDLTFNEGDDFYSHITDKLTGRRVEDIDEVKDALIDEGRLTSGRLNISSSQSYYNAKDQLDAAKQLRDDVESYIEEAGKNDLNQAESSLYTAKQREEELEQQLEKLEKAKTEEEKRERHDELKADKDDIEENLNELDDLPSESDLDDIDQRLQELSEEEGKQSELKEEKEHDLALAKWSIGGGLGAFALLIISGFPIIGVLAPVFFLLASGYFWSQANDVSERIAELSVKEENILSDARAAGISFEDRSEIREEITSLQERREELEEENQGKKTVLERELEFDAGNMRQAVNNAKEALESLEEDIDDSLDVEYDEDAYQETKQEHETVNKRRENLEEDLQTHREQLREFRERELLT
jgi:chromosome segregation ATPase